MRLSRVERTRISLLLWGARRFHGAIANFFNSQLNPVERRSRRSQSQNYVGKSRCMVKQRVIEILEDQNFQDDVGAMRFHGAIANFSFRV